VNAANVLALSRVTLHRAGRPVLQQVDWTVQPGQRWAILGPTGAGKTSLLEVVAAAQWPTAGRVELLGEHLAGADLAALLPRVGWCSPALSDRLPPDDSVLDTVVCAAYAHVARGDEPYETADLARAGDVLGRLGCRELAGRRYGTLSSGQRQLVALARALMPDPELLLLDEPGAGLDLPGRELLRQRLSRLALDPAAPTLVLVTHQVDELPFGTTHVLLLRSGSVLAAGPVEQVLTSRLLSVCFGLPIDVQRSSDRYVAHVKVAVKDEERALASPV
jgi:iron complex transport system ATP-binding protein